MLQALQTFDKSFAEGMLARTSFYLDGDPLLRTLKPIENEAVIRDNIIDEICKNLNIPSVYDNKKAVVDFLDDALEESTRLDAKEEQKILARLSNRGELPTDLYTVKTRGSMVKNFKNLKREEEKLVAETVKKPGMAYNFGAGYGTSIFAKFYKTRYSYNNFFLLVVGKRDGLTFNVDQVWWLYNDILTGNSFSNALELLKYFVEKFGVEVDFQGETRKFFIDVIAKDKNEFQLKVKNDKLKKSKKGNSGFVACHYLGPTELSDAHLSIFFAIDIAKYAEYLKNHKMFP